ncbi:MAG: TolC family protein [Lentisphaerota bacterium]
MIRVFLLLAIVLTGRVIIAEEAVVAEPLTLSPLVSLALSDNANLRAARAKWEAMKNKPAQAGALANPMFTYSGMDMASGGAWPDTNEKRFMLQQEFPWFGKRGLREGIAVKDAEVMQRELEGMTREVVMMVKESYFDLYSIQRVITITREEEAVLQRMEKVAETMYAAGERDQGDVLKAQSEVTMLKQKLLDLQAQESTLKAKLNMLLNRRADSFLGRTVTAPETGFTNQAEAFFALAATNRSEVLAAKAEIERYDREKKLMAKEFLPDYRLGVEYRNLANSDDMAMFTIGVDLPVWRSKNRAGVLEAERMRASSEASRDAAQRQSAYDVQDSLFKLQTAVRTLDLYRKELIPQAEARFSSSEAGYRTGKVDFLDLLESERFLLGAKMMAVMTEGSVGMQSARLERATGADAEGAKDSLQSKVEK